MPKVVGWWIRLVAINRRLLRILCGYARQVRALETPCKTPISHLQSQNPLLTFLHFLLQSQNPLFTLLAFILESTFLKTPFIRHCEPMKSAWQSINKNKTPQNPLAWIVDRHATASVVSHNDRASRLQGLHWIAMTERGLGFAFAIAAL